MVYIYIYILCIYITHETIQLSQLKLVFLFRGIQGALWPSNPPLPRQVSKTSCFSLLRSLEGLMSAVDMPIMSMESYMETHITFLMLRIEMGQNSEVFPFESLVTHAVYHVIVAYRLVSPERNSLLASDVTQIFSGFTDFVMYEMYGAHNALISADWSSPEHCRSLWIGSSWVDMDMSKLFIRPHGLRYQPRKAGCFQTAHEPPVPDGYERRILGLGPDGFCLNHEVQTKWFSNSLDENLNDFCVLFSFESLILHDFLVGGCGKCLLLLSS